MSEQACTYRNDTYYVNTKIDGLSYRRRERVVSPWLWWLTRLWWIVSRKPHVRFGYARVLYEGRRDG